MFLSKNINSKVILFFVLLNNYSFYAQTDSIQPSPYFTKHLTLKDVFFGNEDLYQVCYPKDHRPMFYSIIVFSVSTLILGLLVIYIKNNSNKKLKEKNRIIADQNKDLIDSINYAQHIQQAILPDKETEKATLFNGFVLYKPKHIVSGDFYWLHKCDDIIYVAVIDCTGHGVPGALLTMLAHNAINKAVIEKKIVDPSMILADMNTEVKLSLKQNQNNNIKDSMEVGFVCFNTKTKNLMFAGANTSLTCIHNNELQIIAGGKCSVGSVQEGNVILPVTHSLSLSEGDCFYLYSDGYADQFGGPKGKKFKYKQLEELLYSISVKSVTDQSQILDSTIEKWKGHMEQVDDICVIGVKV